MDEKPYDLPDYRELAADIVSAYVSHNALSHTDLPKLLSETHNQLRALAASQIVTTPPPPPPPAVSIGKSVKPEAIVCLYCGGSFKSLKRHLMTEHDDSPDEYRMTFGLAHDYPMVAPAYSAARSDLAKKIGLGRKPKVA